MYPWIAIGCDTLYEATYVCQYIKAPDYQPVLTSNHTCDGDWFTINGSDKCFTMFWPQSTLSFYDVQDICSAHNSSILTVHTEQRNLQQEKDFFLKQRIEQGMINVYGSMPNNIHLQQEDSLPDTLLGRLIAENSPESQLPSLLSSSLPSSTGLSLIYGESFFANVNNTCNVIQSSLVAYVLYSAYTQLHETRRWGVKCRSCSEPMSISGIICEKDSTSPTRECQSQYFTCRDGSCILFIYSCDLVVDCFDGSDEENCQQNKSNLSHQYITWPYLLDGIDGKTDTHIIPLHTICDGIYTGNIFISEREVCFIYDLKKLSIISMLKGNVKSRAARIHIFPSNISNLYLQEINSLCSVSQYGQIQKENKLTKERNRSIPYSLQKNNTVNNCSNINKLCIIQVNENPCGSKIADGPCKYFVCSGMFKCGKYCIHMSSVCDGQFDCEKGDDEIFCPMSTCPGLLKCRGENRCVSLEEICNNHVNCLYTMDDEVGCFECPVACECNGYSIACHLSNSLERIKKNSINYIKGLIIKGAQQTLFIQDIYFHGLVYVNTSFCNIENILISQKEGTINTYIIIADFQNNKISEINFLRAGIFKNIIYLDLSFNLLPVVKYSTSSVLRKLIVLALRGNPVKEIILNANHYSSRLSLVDLRNIEDYLHSYIVFSQFSHDQIQVKVTELLLCCILHKDIKCTSNNKSKNCFGLFSSEITKVGFYIISGFTITLSAWFVFAKVIHILSQKHLQSKKKNYLIIVVSHLAAEMLVSLYLLGLVFVDVVKVNVYFWTLSPFCLFMKLFLYTSIQAIAVFKTSLIIYVSIQILYPFKHQCSFSKWTGTISLVVWLFILTSCSLTFFDKFQHQDYLCSIGNCSQGNIFSLFLPIICFTDILSVVFCILSVTKLYNDLEKQKKNMSMFQIKNRQLPKNTFVVFKLVIPFIAELPFRICLLILLFIRLAHIMSEEFCKAVILFILPANIIWSSIASMFLK